VVEVIKKRSIVMVEDSASIRMQLKLILEKEGYEVREATNEVGMFKAALVNGEMADLILMDLVLRENNGLDLIANLKSHEGFRDIPVLILTEHAEKDYVRRARNLSVEGYILKPINIAILKERIHMVFEEKDKQESQ
jgi:DNA-binding response OmpR family regulator